MNNSSPLPSWLKDNAATKEDSQPLQHSSSSSSPNTTTNGTFSTVQMPNWGEIFTDKILLMTWAIRFTTLFLCVLMFVTAIIGIGSIDGVESSGKLFVGVYMLFFSALLFIFECMQIYPKEWIDHLFRRNFGFIYGTFGRSLFLIFIAFLSFGLGDPQTLTFTTGTLWALFGVLNLGLYLKYPELFDKTEDDQNSQR